MCPLEHNFGACTMSHRCGSGEQDQTDGEAESQWQMPGHASQYASWHDGKAQSPPVSETAIT